MAREVKTGVESLAVRQVLWHVVTTKCTLCGWKVLMTVILSQHVSILTVFSMLLVKICMNSLENFSSQSSSSSSSLLYLASIVGVKVNRYLKSGIYCVRKCFVNFEVVILSFVLSMNLEARNRINLSFHKISIFP